MKSALKPFRGTKYTIDELTEMIKEDTEGQKRRLDDSFAEPQAAIKHHGMIAAPAPSDTAIRDILINNTDYLE